MSLDAMTAQVRYLKRLLGEVPRNEDGHLVLDATAEEEAKDSLAIIEECLTGRPRN